MITQDELELKRLQLQQWGMYIGVASLIISALGLYWTTRKPQ